jgi:alkanesulfonate monooxygenase SsuD/methylene tetrahydromethanopterin reductase-like flavin-dependent oxidoreductase (luciferase family)
MKFGIHYSLGVGTKPTAEDYLRIAQHAEALGYHSVWLGDHIVIPEQIAAPYPYTKDGSVGFARNTPWPDPFVLLAAIGATTRTILLGTSVVIVPYRNPLHVAKAVATLDLVSRGRYQFGVGIGWLQEEFAALGESFSERAARTREYLHVAALKRVADLGDGWQPGPVPLEVFRERVGRLQTLMAERGREMAQLSISMIGDALDLQRHPEKLDALEELGVKEMVLFMAGASVDATLHDLDAAARALPVG